MAEGAPTQGRILAGVLILGFLVIVITSFKPSSDRHLPLNIFSWKIKENPKHIIKDKFIIKNELKKVNLRGQRVNA